MKSPTNNSTNNIVTPTKLYLALSLIAAFAGIYLLGPVLIPFLFGGLIAYLANPLVLLLKRQRFSRTLATSIVFSGLLFMVFLIVLLFIPLVQKQTTNLIELWPHILTWIQQTFDPWLQHNFDISVLNDDANDNLKNLFSEHFLKSGSSVSTVFATVLSSSKAVFEGMINVILIPFVTFYVLRDWEKILTYIYQTIPSRYRAKTVSIANECDEVMGAFFRGQLLVMLFLGIFYAIALSLIGLKIGVVVGLIVGIISIVPYLGAILGVVIASIAALVQFGTLASVFWVWGIFIVGHAIENFYLTPRLIGNRIGLHPLAVIFAILAGGTLFGFIGILLAMPVAALIVVFLKHTSKYLKKNKSALTT